MLISSFCFAQSNAGAIWLLNSASTSLNGIGEIGVCIPDRDLSAGYFNPANGIKSYKSISLSYSNMETKWLQNLASDLNLKYSYLGLNLIPDKYPFQFVITKQDHVLDLGEQIYMDEYANELGRFSSRMSAHGYSVAARYFNKFRRIPMDISFGITRKNVIQNLVPDKYLSSGSGTSENIFYDVGILASLPISYTIKDKWSISISPAFGYSISNIGDSIVFVDPANADPGPRLARAGISLSAKISLHEGLNLFEFRGGRAASDLLVLPIYNQEEPIRYQSGFGDIRFIKNITQSKSDSAVEVSRGHEVTFFDIYSYRFGRRVDVAGKIDLYEYGYGINSGGILDILHYLTRIRPLFILNQYVSVRYDYSKWTDDGGRPLDDTEFSSYTISINNTDKLIKWAIDRYGVDREIFNQIGLTILSGVNFSIINFNDKDVQKNAKVKYDRGGDFGIETKFNWLTMGLSYTQYSVRYQIKVLADIFRFTPMLNEIYHYFTFYSLLTYSIIKPINLFGGIQIANCIGRNVKVDNTTECYNSAKYSLNYGLITGIDILPNSWFGIRISYNYWLRELNNIFNDESFRINGIRLNILIKL